LTIGRCIWSSTRDVVNMARLCFVADDFFKHPFLLPASDESKSSLTMSCRCDDSVDDCTDTVFTMLHSGTRDSVGDWVGLWFTPCCWPHPLWLYHYFVKTRVKCLIDVLVFLFCVVFLWVVFNLSAFSLTQSRLCLSINSDDVIIPSAVSWFLCLWTSSISYACYGCCCWSVADGLFILWSAVCLSACHWLTFYVD